MSAINPKFKNLCSAKKPKITDVLFGEEVKEALNDEDLGDKMAPKNFKRNINFFVSTQTCSKE